eukprot:TRINITY_DN46086_c0_g1_i1.p1 TRINITY_DN46086_c0_g1~~TRINITY_DN46086_c0_g1_i1.p1  ORF type:complete len:574 (-),score=79.47 TRINITY_DN46086_c0_g1_i1:11-1732(-)
MGMPSVAWLIVFWLGALLVWQNEELDLTPFSCGSNAIQQLYDTLAFFARSVGVHDFLSASSTASTRRILERCGTGSGDVVLELGFGTGRLARLLVENVSVRRYDGLELSEGMLNLTAQSIADGALHRLNLHHSADPIQLLQTSEDLSDSYSHAFALFVLDSLGAQEIEHVQNSLYARLRPGGRLCIASLVDLPEKSLSLRVYKAAWRSAPLLLGGRRPIALRKMFADQKRWSVLESWVDDSEGLFPFEVLVLQRGAGLKEYDRETMLQRWAPHLVALGMSGNESEPSIRRVVVASADYLPPGPMKDLAKWWLRQLPNATLRAVIENDLVSMSREDILADYERTLRSMPAAQLLQELRSWIRSLETSSLEAWTVPDTDAMGFEDLQQHVLQLIGGAISEAVNDPELMQELLRHKEAASGAKSFVELKQLSDRIEKDLFVAPSEMSRSELERVAMENAQQLSRRELEEELFGEYTNQTLEELRGPLLAELVDLPRDELEERARDVLEYATAERLRPVARVVASDLLSSEDLRLLASFVADLDVSDSVSIGEVDVMSDERMATGMAMIGAILKSEL